MRDAQAVTDALAQALDVREGGAWERRGADGRGDLAVTAVLDAGGGALVRCCPEASYRSADTAPLALLVVTIAPVPTGTAATPQPNPTGNRLGV